jgi:hypothetical protein
MPTAGITQTKLQEDACWLSLFADCACFRPEQYGMECLFRFYSYGLEKAFSAELYRDFEETTLKDFKAAVPPRLYGLEKVGSGFWV